MRNYLNKLFNFSIVSLYYSILWFFFFLFLNNIGFEKIKFKTFLGFVVIFYILSLFISFISYTAFKLLTNIKFHSASFNDPKTISLISVANLFYFVLIIIFNRNTYSYFLDKKLMAYMNYILFFSAMVLLISFVVTRKSYQTKKHKTLLILPVLIFLIFPCLFFLDYKFVNLKKEDVHLNNQSNKSHSYNKFELQRRVINIYIEGLSPDLLFEISSKKDLSNFEFLMRNGSWGKVKSFKPVYKLSHLATYLTGRYPYTHKFVSFGRYKLYDSHEVSFFFKPHLLMFSFIEKVGLVKKTYYFDPNMIEKLFYLFELYGVNHSQMIDFFEKFYADSISKGKNFSVNIPPVFEEFFNDKSLETPEEKILYYALIKDIVTFKTLLEKIKSNNSQFYVFYFDGLLEVEKYFFRYKYPDIFYKSDEEEIIKFGNVIDDYYALIDRNIGKILTLMKKEDLLIINSSFGIETVNPFIEALKFSKNKEKISGTYKNAPDGVIIFYGNSIKKDKVLKNFRVVNAYPIILYYLGYPFEKRFLNKVSFKMFSDEFLKENPLIFTEEK